MGNSKQLSVPGKLRSLFLGCSAMKILMWMTGVTLAALGTVWTILSRSADPSAILFVQGRLNIAYRVFGPAVEGIAVPEMSAKHQGAMVFQLYTKAEQRDFLHQFGHYCQKGIIKDTRNVLLERFDELPDPLATELWKYCVLYTGVGNVYWQPDNLDPLVLWDDLFTEMSSRANIAIKIVKPDSDEDDFEVSHSMLRMPRAKSRLSQGMMRFISEATVLEAKDISKTLALFVKRGESKGADNWKFFTGQCVDTGGVDSTWLIKAGHKRLAMGQQCPVKFGGHCCQVWQGDTVGEGPPTLVIRNPHVGLSDVKRNPRPYKFRDSEDGMNDASLGMRSEILPYIATIREYPTGAPKATQFETPNFFDILMENNCLPEGKECFRCLKSGYNPDDVGGDCNVCQKQCPCYCSALCRIRPPPKRLAAEWVVTPPRYRKDPTRLIPRVIHQTWYEPVTPDKYPNMSRLIESFRQAGWEYEFYDDDRSAEFLSANFPPIVREAYETIIPGAFKADLFRYCVLLILGGVYADMDIILESNLDDVLDGSVGYLTAQDSPGMTIGHRHCLWNGLMASAPGHPFLAQTVQNVVNNVQNRFTSVDYDDMLCPDPVLSIAHTVDTLFVCGPCILGASMNDILKKHRQSNFDFGDIDLYEMERKLDSKIEVEPDDPRLLIPGRAVLLKQDKEDMGAHRFTWEDRNLVVASTDLPDSDDRPKSLEHYSKTHEKFGIYGLHKLYTNDVRTNEEMVIRIASP